MAGYVSQLRQAPGFGELMWHGSSFPYESWRPYSRFQYPVQFTTSWRDSGDDLAGDSFDVEATSESDFLQRLSDEYRSAPSSSYDTGHTFDTRLETIEIPVKRIKIYRGGSSTWYEGPLMDDFSIPPGQQGGWDRTVTPTDIGVYGPRAIANTVPTKTIAGLNVALAEIARDGIPHAVGAALSHAEGLFGRAIGHEYLNVQFGWKPLVADIQKAAHAVLEAHKLLKQYARDSGRNVRRRYYFPQQKTVTTMPVITGAILDPGMDRWSEFFVNGRTGAPLHQTTTVTRDIWFSGAYTYHLPDADNIIGKSERFAEMANHLLGLELTPEVVWKLAPWSWLVDWVVNIGNNVTNLSHLSSDGLVIRYGYLMVKTTTVQERTLESLPLSMGGETGPLTTIRTTIRKERFRATPFGFGLNPDGFSASQWAILGALGMTRGPQTLR